MRLQNQSLLALAALFISACAAGAGDAPIDDIGNDPPLADVDEIMFGVPDRDSLPMEYKADEILPTVFSDLVELQSAVKSQGRRGVCSIFSTVGFMEHLYIAAGAEEPDFSEQYLQWSAKFEVGSFPKSSGSNAYYNLQAINRYGVVEETVWPYETNQWDSSNDEKCTGEDDQPTFCYTNGHPSEAIKDAQKFKLPRSRYMNPRSIKGHLFNQRTAVVAGMTFFYQSWNHRKSQLPTNSDTWDRGIVLYPNAEDKKVSLEKRAGHSIVLVGWDEEIEVPIVDDKGEQVLDESGEVVTEKGFYIFKNSWGTSGFGIENPHGPGFGYISMRYVHEYASARVSGLPDVEVAVEICGDGIDNDKNNLTDCDDSACSAEPACQSNGGEVLTIEGEGGIDIPDNSPVGISSTISAERSGTIAKLAVSVDISHSYRGDLRVSLHRGGEAVVLHSRSGGGARDLVETFEVPGMVGIDLSGDWKLLVVDAAAVDVGTLNSWSLDVVLDAD